MTNYDIIPGSITDLSQSTGKSLAQLFIDVDLIVIFDSSQSMAMHDAPGGKSRYDAGTIELIHLQAIVPGKLAIISFSDRAQWCLNGVPEFMGQGTNLAGALRFAREVDNEYTTFCVISDGEPDSEEKALSVAKTLKAKINCVYVGPENGRGRAFLERLATEHRGTYDLSALAVGLGRKMMLMLEG